MIVYRVVTPLVIVADQILGMPSILAYVRVAWLASVCSMLVVRWSSFFVNDRECLDDVTRDGNVVLRMCGVYVHISRKREAECAFKCCAPRLKMKGYWVTVTTRDLASCFEEPLFLDEKRRR